MDEVNKFLGEFGQNNEGLEEVAPIEGVEVQTEMVEETQPEEKLPFYKDPKVQRYIDKQLDKRMKELTPVTGEKFVQENQDNPYLSYAEKLMGTETDENKMKSQILAQTLLEIQNKASETSYNRFSEESRAERQAEIESANELQEGLDRIEENFGVDLSSNSPSSKKTRNDFLDFVGHISPKNEYGEIKEYADLESAFDAFKEMRKPETNIQAKQIVSRGMSNSNANSSGTPTRRVTAANLRSVMGLE